tara:strand:+ start:768 stop:1085 length:318 start_codon:yes stop_codon:yes gene_type:complete
MLNKFFYFKDVAKRDTLIAVDRFNGLQDIDADTIRFHFNNLGNDQDNVQGIVTFDITSGEAKECLEEILNVSANHPFTVLVDEITTTSVSSRYVAGGTTISSEIE